MPDNNEFTNEINFKYALEGVSSRKREIEIRSDEVQEILSKTPNWMIRWGITLIFTLMALLLVLSWCIQYPDVISAEAIVTTQVPPQKEFAKVNGKFETILVKNNEVVTKNQLLAVLENSADYEDVLFLQKILDTIQVNKNDFKFPVYAIPILVLGQVEDSYANFENNYIQYRINKEYNPLSNPTKANQFSIREQKKRLENLYSQKKIAAKELKIVHQNLQIEQTLFENGVISAKQFNTKKLEYLQAERNYENMNTTISQLKEAISNTSKNIKGNEISSIRENLILLKKVIQSYNQLKESMKNWELNYVLKSEINGKVSFLDYWNKNQTVQQGEQIFTIIPEKNSAYIAKIKSTGKNLGKIKIGQRVNVKLHNYPSHEFGTITGKVHNISETTTKEGNYIITISLPKKLVTHYKKEIEFKQEMRGIADIITEESRLIERFFYQFKKIWNTTKTIK